MLPATSASTSSRREMLQAMTWASPPALRMPLATSSQASALREEITTFAPSLASSSADERPMPRLEPVMTATCPVRSKGVDFMDVSSGSQPTLSSPGIAVRRTASLSLAYDLAIQYAAAVAVLGRSLEYWMPRFRGGGPR